MSENFETEKNDRKNVFSLPVNDHLAYGSTSIKIPTPIADKMEESSAALDRKSAYKSNFDFDAIRSIERRFADNPIRGGITFKSPFKLVNSHSTCQQCLYAFELDTYGRGCIHNCVYCYAKAELTVHGYWNNPIPAPADINEIRKVFHTIFETDRKSKWRSIMEKRTPLRIGSMSDSFMWIDKKYKVTQELLKLLKFYRYPYIIFTRSDLLADEQYLSLLDEDLAAIQYSISSTNDDLNKKIEPGAPSAARRLKALKRINEAGFWTTVRLNPFFPIYPDGYFSDPEFEWKGEVPKFKYSSFDMIDEIADAKVPAILAGMGRFSSFSMNQLEKATKFDLRQLYKTDPEIKTSRRDYHFSAAENWHYYLKIKERCKANGIEFTTCYIGNGEKQFWRDQKLWDNKKDCCNVKGRVKSFKADCREIPFENRLKFTNHKCATPNSERLHEPLGANKKPRSGPAKRDPELTL